MKNRKIVYCILLLIGSFVGCTSLPHLEANNKLGIYKLPHKVNSNFIISQIEYSEVYLPDSISYFLYGKQRIFSLSDKVSEDKYIKYLGAKGFSDGSDGPIYVEHIIILASGERIAFSTNNLGLGYIKIVD
jgi:hypothetical protein